jgi:hypothetical protein
LGALAGVRSARVGDSVRVRVRVRVRDTVCVRDSVRGGAKVRDIFTLRASRAGASRQAHRLETARTLPELAPTMGAATLNLTPMVGANGGERFLRVLKCVDHQRVSTERVL